MYGNLERIMNDFGAILAVNEHVQGSGDDALIAQWNIVKSILHHHIWGSPPSPMGGGGIEWAELTRQIPITEKGSEVLLFRMARALEVMGGILEKELGWRECCRVCGGELDEDGDRSVCLASAVAHRAMDAGV
jgi:hypothetical protein